MPKVSILIPVYNAEKTLRRCVDSVLHQEYTDFELILVDDGSRDNSPAICDNYARKDDRVKVIHAKNGGVSRARNLGINAASGAYLQFIDADDWLTVDATKLLVRAMEEHQCDLVIADFYRVSGERISHKGDIDGSVVLTREEFAQEMMENPADFYYGVLWNKLFRRDLIQKHQLHMDESVEWCEDFLFNLEYLLYVDRIFALQAPIYYYVKTEGSLIQRVSLSDVVKMKLSVFEYYRDFYKNVLDEEEYEKKRLGLYKFFIDLAKDGAILPGSQKLGRERVSVSAMEELNDTVFAPNYEYRKLMERCTETVALCYDLDVDDVLLFSCLCQSSQLFTRRQLADYTGLPVVSISLSLQKLSFHKFIDVTHYADGFQVTLLEKALPLCRDLKQIHRDFDAICFQGFSEEEEAQFRRFTDRIISNVHAALLPQSQES